MDNVDTGGSNIHVEEMPIGCVITDTDRGSSVVVASLEDINKVVESLSKIKEEWY